MQINCLTKLCMQHPPVLQNCVLPATRGVVDWHVHDLSVLAEKEGGLPV